MNALQKSTTLCFLIVSIACGLCFSRYCEMRETVAQAEKQAMQWKAILEVGKAQIEAARTIREGRP